ncbi:hypothetical protein SAMN05444413_11030 [Roseivivax marinus]|uniref:hypothetical protein n=1 Tax=Roseivivax marinus TaxID=1379903 RepID=UPI0008B0B2B2|nr:hypothetical protein [Roseivivax marinus]SEL51922.1 hypothetical protein SAMN05444413_11030 [Roseivivax marinus]
MSAVGHDGPTSALRRGTARDDLMRGVVGAVVLLLLLAAAERFLFAPGFYDTLTLHPFWIVILIAALQHGTAVGCAAVAMATVLMGWPDRLVGEDAAVYAARAAVLPLQWLVVALIVGLYRQKQIVETETLRADAARLEGMTDSLAAEVERMDDMIVSLEREAAARPAADPAPAPVPTAKGALLRRALPELSALAGARGDELPATFEAAARALLDGPVALVARDPADGTLLLGDGDALGDDAETAAMALRAAAEDVTGATVTLSAAGLPGGGAVRLAERAATVEAGLTAMVVFRAVDAAAADAAADRVEILAEMARISIDRLSRDLGLGADDAGKARRDRRRR